jgi:putative ABC transport system ATP-binding protein
MTTRIDDHAHTSPSRRLLDLLALERESLGVIAIYAVAVGIVSLAAPLGVQAMVSAIAFGGLRQPLAVLSLLVVGALGFAALLRALQWSVAERIQERIFVRTAFDVTRKLSHVRPSALDGAHPREFVNRFFDVVTIQKGASTLLIDGVYIVLQAFVGAVVLAFYHSFLLAYAILLIAAVTIVTLPLGRVGVRTAVAESASKYAVVAWFEEMASHATAFRSLEGEVFATERAKELTARYLLARRAHFRFVFRQGVAFFTLQALATAALLGVGGLLVLEGQITVGQLVAAELIVTSTTGAFAKFGKYLESYYDLLAALDKVGYLTDIQLERATGEGLPASSNITGAALVARHVALEVGGRAVLVDVSLEVQHGERVALFGSNGAGKSAFLDVLWGIEEPTAGTVELFGVPLSELDVRRLRDDVMLARGAELFDGSIADNVRVGRVDLDANELRAALETVGLWEEIARLPGGLNAQVRGSGLSDGQVRRVLLARAIARRPRVLLIDGVLDGIDTVSRDAVARGILAADAPWAVVLATHDASIAELATRTCTLAAGRTEVTSRTRAPRSPNERG